LLQVPEPADENQKKHFSLIQNRGCSADFNHFAEQFGFLAAERQT
jgi:hypothetical protein